ncbi:outer membrane protein assembly factor BamB family protein [Urbifossiella limnaea]|uniref:Outer membrane biogenesis protein BamB n=1 Tax=Urbifossiella limnaea TaxID=2528023 RepID=A0A517Y161_9BACT|nr:PQQ-binding-like beta-propeller repeat protein [Urbifossiella limnaea]QDU23463.1 outer membrane biogenesis protein BamB [Urbifossiella limnaea]
MNLFLLPLLLCADPTPAPAWPGFRGDGTSTSAAKNLPLTWSPTENLAWRAPLPGYGQSSPVVWNGRVYVTAVDGAEKEKLLVVAVDAATGRAAWAKEFAAGQKGKNNPMMSRAAPTPVADSDGVVAFFESGDVVALTHAGGVRWQRSLTKDYGAFKNNHGVGSSPAQTDAAVVILIDDGEPSYLVALDKATGKTVWKADRKGRSSWTSPVAARVGGRPAVVVSSSGSLDAYDAATGAELATLGGLVGNNIPSPAVAGDLVVFGAGEGRAKAGAAAPSNGCVRLAATGSKLAFEPEWELKRVVSHHASPLVHRGHAYFVTKAGLVHCVDLATGAERYAERLDNPCWATPVGAGEHVYFFGRDGVTTVLKAGPEFEKVAANRFWGAADFARRQAEAREQAAATLPRPPEGKGPGGGPPVSPEERDAARYSAVGDVVYGVAAVDGGFFARTGTELICVRGPGR